MAGLSEDATSMPPALPDTASAPKPVEVTSVPETPVNTGTPAGGTPRPELNVVEEARQSEPRQDANAILGHQNAAVSNRPDPEPVDDIGGPDNSMLLPTGSKRRTADEDKVELEAPAAGTDGSSGAAHELKGDGPLDKKTKIADKAEAS